MSAKQWHDVIGVSLHGFFNVVQPLLLPMLRTRWGRIVAISSISADLGNRGQANYAAAKAGMEGAMRSLSLEIGSRGVTVNAVAPGIIDTAMTAGAFDAARIEQLVPLRRAGTAVEVAGLVDFLMSERAGYITGQVIPINGGMA
jgi:3-oxoacyl-[acyl-carrier protein] reductase